MSRHEPANDAALAVVAVFVLVLVLGVILLAGR